MASKALIYVGFAAAAVVVGTGVYLVTKPAAAAAAAPAALSIPPSGTWKQQTLPFTIAAGQKFLLSLSGDAATSMQTQILAASPALVAEVISGIEYYEIGTPPPPGWPSDDTLGTTAFRVSGTAINATPVQVVTGSQAQVWV